MPFHPRDKFSMENDQSIFKRCCIRRPLHPSFIQEYNAR